MPTPDEKQVLRIIEEEGGETHQVKISNQMGLRLDYIKTILGSLGRRDFIDVFASGKVRLTSKGWKALGKEPGGDLYYKGEKISPESPEEKYKRWTAS